MGIPHYVPGPCRNRALTSDMAMEKIRPTSAAHFSILRNPDFFTVDGLGVNHTFYEIPLQKATGENPVDIVSRARSSYTGYSFTNIDLRDKIKIRGTRGKAKETVEKNSKFNKEEK